MKCLKVSTSFAKKVDRACSRGRPHEVTIGSGQAKWASGSGKEGLPKKGVLRLRYVGTEPNADVRDDLAAAAFGWHTVRQKPTWSLAHPSAGSVVIQSSKSPRRCSGS